MSDKISVLIEETDIDRRIRELGAEITGDYEGEEICLIPILKGASFFGCELAKRIEIPVFLDFMALSSYGSGTVSSGEVQIKKDVDTDVEGKNVLLVEDIIDTGNTFYFLTELFLARKAKSVKLCALLDKPDRRKVDVKMDYVGFTIPDKFVVGYGLDYDQKYRNLPYIGVVETD